MDYYCFHDRDVSPEMRTLAESNDMLDRVSDVLRVSREAIRPPPLLTQNERARYFAGVCHHRGRILMVLDLDAILSSTEKISLAGLNQAAKGAP